MPVVNTEIVTHHSPENLFQLVSDIARYPEFIRWIKAMRVSSEREDSGVSYKLGEALVGFKGFTERFATNVIADPAQSTVTAKLVRGPFRKLKNTWEFSAIEPGKTRVKFHIDYEFSNPVLAMLARKNTDSAIENIVKSFLMEADRRYGPENAS